MSRPAPGDGRGGGDQRQRCPCHGLCRTEDSESSNPSEPLPRQIAASFPEARSWLLPLLAHIFQGRQVEAVADRWIDVNGLGQIEDAQAETDRQGCRVDHVGPPRR